MRVLFVIPGAELGGVQTHVGDLAAGLARHGVESRVVAGAPGSLFARLERKGIPHECVPMRSRADRRAIPVLAEIARAWGAELVHTHGPLAGILGRRAAQRASVPMIHTLHGAGVLDELSRPAGLVHRFKLEHYRVEERSLNRASAAVIAVSESVAARARAARHVVDARLVVIPNGVAPASAAGPPPGAPVVGYVGRLHPGKGVEDLLAAFAAIAGARPDARLRIVGDGPERAAIGAAAANAGGRVELWGERESIDEALEGLSCLVLPSRAEGLSYVLLEAMARAVPCVATEVGGNPELVRDAITGLGVPAGDRGALARAIARLLDDAALAVRLGRAGRDHVRAHFTLDRMLDETLTVYRRVLGARPS